MYCTVFHSFVFLIWNKLENIISGYVETARRSNSTCIIRDDASGKFLGKLLNNNNKHSPSMQPSTSQSSSSDSGQPVISQSQPENTNSKQVMYKSQNEIVDNAIASDVEVLPLLDVRKAMPAAKLSTTRHMLPNMCNSLPRLTPLKAEMCRSFCNNYPCVKNLGMHLENEKKTLNLGVPTTSSVRTGENSAALCLLSTVRSALGSKVRKFYVSLHSYLFFLLFLLFLS